MEQNHKQNFFKPSETMSNSVSREEEESSGASSTQWRLDSSEGGVSNNTNGNKYKSVSSGSEITKNYYGCQVSGGQSQREQKAITHEKSHSIRGFLKLLPFMPRFKRKTSSSKENNDQKQTALSRIRICPSSSLEENDVRKLIKLYRGYENLYNPNHDDYGNSKREDICFSRIAYSFPKKTCQELQNLLYELRVLFEREYTIIENAQRRFGQMLLPTIKYYNEFMFLVPFLNIKWDSVLCLPPERTISDNNPINQNTSLQELKQIDGSEESEDEKESPLEISEQTFNSEMNPMRPTAGLNMLNTFNTPVFGNQFMCFGKKKSRAKQIEKPLTDQSKPLPDQPHAEPKASQELDPKDELSEQPQPSNLVNWNVDETPKRLSEQQDPLKQKRTSQSEVTPPENLLKDPLENRQVKDIPLPPQKRPCPVKGDRESCKPNCTKVCQQRTSSPETPIPEASPARISDQTNPGNQEQLQMLCDMIKMELSSSPDFIYYDAKWRIIEILREVQKRNLIHSKSNPENNRNVSVMPKNSNCPNRNRQESTNVAPRNRIHVPKKATQCPYCNRR